MSALVVDNVGKAYAHYASELHRIANWFGAGAAPVSQQWVLRHVSFRVAPGETVGIVGQNGAGKSTLLKMIVGTTQATEGTIASTGRIAALLELGLGFNPELTGRENAIHACGLMGVRHADVASLLPRIEAFAEIGEYFDEPMRKYSSGMHMRVGFAVATAVRPDVLIVDEALAVGDAYFVHKCFARIREYRDAGTTVLLVSHDAGAIQALCDRAILLDKGTMLMDGDPRAVLDYYNALIAEKENATVRLEQRAGGETGTVSGTGEASLESLQLVDAEGQPVEYVTVGQPVALRARVRIHAPIARLVFGYMVRDRLGQPVYGTNTHFTEQAVEDARPGETYAFDIRFDANFGVGSYSVSVALSSTETHLVRNYQWTDLALVFTVANANKPTFVGMAYIPPAIAVTRLEDA